MSAATAGLQTLCPKPFLLSLQGERVAVRLKWGLEYRGKLMSFDRYFNIQLDQASEWKEGEFAGDLGQLFIRCNNICWVRADGDLQQPIASNLTASANEQVSRAAAEAETGELPE